MFGKFSDIISLKILCIPSVCISEPSSILINLIFGLYILSHISWKFCTWSLTSFLHGQLYFPDYIFFSLLEAVSSKLSSLLMMHFIYFLIWFIDSFQEFPLDFFSRMSTSLLKSFFTSYIFSLISLLTPPLPCRSA